MSSIFDVSGNNLPELTSTSGPRDLIHYFRQMISSKRNMYSEPATFAAGYNLAIEELMNEIDRLESMNKFPVPVEITDLAQRCFNLTRIAAE